ncbi:MAG: secretin N-terminal domain-containing protein [Holosporales bacterium]|jgi:general secretion pathway protein D|nr:secretin N-terminal domain-containing protein [Holosporales bacterium]
MKKLLVSCLCFLLLPSCDRAVEKNYLSKGVNPTSVKSLTNPVEDESEEKIFHIRRSEPEFIIPDVMKQNVSLSLNDKLPIRSVLCETSKKLNIDFQMDPSINTKIIFSVHNRPFIEVLDAICDMANLRYSIHNNIVSVVNDLPYTATYSLRFLNFSRDSENKISIATEVSSGASQENSSGTTASGKTVSTINTNTGGSSDSNVTVKTKNDFWAEFEEGIKVILGKKEDACYSINKQSGIVTVSANSKQQKCIRDYIGAIKSSTESQVLIEAKIIEVVLKNEYRRGIDWSILSKKIDITAESGMRDSVFDSATTPFSGKYKSKGMNILLNAIEEFGATRTISNPRITAMNNQAAILKVAENHVYFKLNYDKTSSLTDNGRDNTSVSSDIRTVPIGLVMFVQPSIDTANGTITLFLRPTISKLSGSKRDPAVDIAIRSMDKDNKDKYEPSCIPVTEVREVSSVLKLNDGEIAVLGGFMEVRSSKNKSGMPHIKDVPFIGEAVSSMGTGDEVVELVILIKVKIVGDHNQQQRAADIRLQRFVPDPRPF